MAISKNKRSKVRAKADVCWYCEEDLEKGWDIDHVIPKSKYSKERKCLIVDGKPFTEYGLNSIENLVPVCRSCNLFKGQLSVEEFRTLIQNQPKILASNRHGYRMASKFGIIKVILKPVVFWFETRNYTLIHK